MYYYHITDINGTNTKIKLESYIYLKKSKKNKKKQIDNRQTCTECGHNYCFNFISYIYSFLNIITTLKQTKVKIYIFKKKFYVLYKFLNFNIDNIFVIKMKL